MLCARFTRTTDRVVDDSQPALHLTPNKDNFHEFNARSHCVVFDILLPPYDEDQGRSCGYYKATMCTDGHAKAEACFELQAAEEPANLPFMVQYLGDRKSTRLHSSH